MTEIKIVIDGQPRSKARPRFTGSGKVYSDATQRAHEELIAWSFRSAVSTPLTVSVEMDMVFYRSDQQRIDLDNLVKAVLDGANGICFVDDVQVVAIAARIELDRDRPRTEIVVRERETSMPRGDSRFEIRQCPTCGEEFRSRSFKSAPEGQRFCSRACLTRRRGTCPECGDEFTASGSRQVYCSKKCAAASQAVKAKIAAARAKAARPANRCRHCQTKLARQTSVLCRECWRKVPSNDKGKVRAEILETEARAAA